MSTGATDVVADPVSHISISGVHGQDEVDERIAHATPQVMTLDGSRGRMLGTLLLGAAVGAALMYAFNSKR